MAVQKAECVEDSKGVNAHHRIPSHSSIMRAATIILLVSLTQVFHNSFCSASSVLPQLLHYGTSDVNFIISERRGSADEARTEVRI